MKALSESQYDELKAYILNLNGINWGVWPSCDQWPKISITYSLNQYEQINGQIFTVIKFAEVVKLPDGRMGKRFKVSGGISVFQYF